VKNFLVFLLLLLVSPIIAKGYAVITVYYNGTVIAHIYNESEFTLIGDYVGGLHVIGSKYNFTGNKVYLENPGNVTIYYQASFKGVIKARESYYFSLNVILPSSITITYLSTPPYSFSAINNFYNISFKDVNNVVILYAVTKSKNNTVNFPILVLMVIDVILIGLIVWLLLGKRKVSVPRKEEVTLVNDVLDERDKMVLDAIKSGAKTLSEIINKTGLPKATAYRRVKKLVSLGYVEEIRERGKVYYKFKEKA